MMAADLPHGSNPLITYTLFHDVTPVTKIERSDVAWSDLVEHIVDAPTYISKAACPLISLAEYGDQPTDRGCIRHAANVRRVFGVELDYDGEQMPPEEAAALLASAGLECVLYTSPSHAQQRPRWRVLLPLSEPALPEKRAEYVARANRVLRGGASRESFTLSQSFYVGRVRGAPYIAIPIHGRTVDLSADIEPMYFTGAGSDGKTKVSTVTDAELRERFRSGDGRYEAMLSLSARWAARGMSAQDIAAALDALLAQGNTAHNTDGVDLRTRVGPMASSAVAKFGETRRRPASDAAPRDIAPPTAELPPLHVYAEHLAGDAGPPLDGDPAPHDDGAWYMPDNCRITLEDLEVAPPAPEMVVRGYLPCDIGVRYGEGGTGKTTLSLYEAVHIVFGRPIFGFDVVRAGPVLLLSGEDDMRRIKYRLHHVCQALGLDSDAREHLRQNLYIVDASARRIPFVAAADHDALVQTVHLDRFMRAYEPIGLAATFIDPAVSFGPGERYVNDGEHALMLALRRYREAVGGGVFLQHHVSKQSSRDAVVDQYAGRGGAAMSDAARAVHVLVRHDVTKSDLPIPPDVNTEDIGQGRVLRAHIPKLTDGKATPEAVWIVRTGSWGFERVRAAEAGDANERAVRTLLEFLRQRTAAGERHTARSLRDSARAMGLPKRAVEAATEHALVNGRAVERELPPDERRGQRKTFLEAV